MQRLTLFIAVLVVVSLVSAFSIYISLVGALDSSMINYITDFSDVRLQGFVATSSSQLDTIRNVCTVTNVEDLSNDRYIGSASSCDKQKINSLLTSNDADELIHYRSLSTTYVVHSIGEDYEITFREMYPKEGLLFWEKTYDIMGLLFFVMYAGTSFTAENAMSNVCYEELNKSSDCMHALFEAEGIVANKLIDEVTFGNEFLSSCADMFESNPAFFETSMMFDNNIVCKRVSYIAKKVFEKSKNRQDHDDYSIFYTVLIFHTMSNHGKYSSQESRVNKISNMVAEVIDPRFKTHFQNLGTRKNL
jgi:hypothetical protein